MPPLYPRVALAALFAASLGFSSLACAADEKESKATQSGDSQYDVPEGTPEELLDFIKKHQNSAKRLSSDSGGLSRKERMARIRNSFQAIVTAADRISDKKVNDATVVAALKAELEALAMLKRLSDDDAAKKDASDKLDALTEKLKNDKRPAVANLLKAQALTQKMERLDTTDAAAVAAFTDGVKEYSSTAEADLQFARLAHAATVLLFNSGKKDEAAALGREFTEKLSQSKSPEVVMASAQLASQVVGPILEMQGQEKQAAAFYRKISERLAKSDNDTLQQVAEQLEGSAKKLELVGQPMPISGKLLDGGKFDISQFKGKVVLVDFWATWCGPCLAELPNVKEVYEKYHDRGFEVVGISLDSDVDDLTKFIKDEHIPWPILFEGGDDASGWEHPLAKKYGVSAIPLAVLVDRQGKVVTLNARGERLAEMVDELLGAKPASGADAGPVKKKAG